jgi:hypothetical protein
VTFFALLTLLEFRFDVAFPRPPHDDRHGSLLRRSSAAEILHGPAAVQFSCLSPPPEAQRNFAGLPGPDSWLIFLNCIRDPNQLQPTIDHMRAQYEAEAAKRRPCAKKH